MARDERAQGTAVSGNGTSQDAAEIDLHKRGGIEEMMARAGSGRLQPMRGFDPGWFVRRASNEVWNRRRFDKLKEYFVPNYLCYTSSDRTIYGLGDYRSYVLAMIAAFPDAGLDVDYLYWVGNGREGYRVATRWTLIGTHDGPSPYGAPTGNPVNVMGITHHLIRDERFVAEWTVFDELALLKQIRG